MQPLIKSFRAGETIFREGFPGTTTYILRKGKVEISIWRDMRKIVLDILSDGAVFGEMAPVVGGERSATAMALEATEAYCIQAKCLQELVEGSGPFLKVVVHGIIQRIRKMNDAMAAFAREVHPYQVVAEILEMQAQAIDPDLAEETHHVGKAMAIKRICGVTGFSEQKAGNLLQSMSLLHLLEIGHAVGGESMISFHGRAIARLAGKAANELRFSPDNVLFVDNGLIGVEDLARILEVDPKKIPEMWANGELPEDFFFCSRVRAVEFRDGPVGGSE